MTDTPAIFKEIDRAIQENDVVLFMKGSAKMPQCGFSALVAEVLKRSGVAYRDINVLANPELREGIKAYTDWPTIPQLYVKGEFIGGCDIVREMYESGELDALWAEKGVNRASAEA